jgi:hypothetical protein
VRRHLNKSALALTICLPSLILPLVTSAGRASAEWKAESWPCNVAPSALLPLPVQWFTVGEPAEPPTGYFTYGAEPSQAPPPSNFTATADWGDGTISPADVEATSVGDCYSVSTAGHPYSAVGTYTFSYTVHDIETGLDHVLATTELHAWAKAPITPSGSPPAAVEPVRGPEPNPKPDLTPPATLRFQGQPMLAIVRRAQRAPLYEFVFRLNRPLPQTDSGHVDATMHAFGHTDQIRRLLARSVTACYATQLGGVGNHRLAGANTYAFTLTVPSKAAIHGEARILPRAFADQNRMSRAVAKRLGCTR